MPNLTTPIPPKLCGKSNEDLIKFKEWGTALIDELSYILNNLDAGNVIEASSVKAENIDTATALIENAKIGLLTADKLSAGTLDTNKVTVSSSNGALKLSDAQIVITDNKNTRFLAAYNSRTRKFNFVLCNNSGTPTVSIDSGGNAVFTGKVESSSVYSSTIIGTDSASYAAYSGGVFAQLDPTGIKVMQDKNNDRNQKIGMSVADDGTAYMVLGAGNGSGRKNINGVEYSNGAFVIEKNLSGASLGIKGYSPFINLWEDSGQLWLSGSSVLINGLNIEQELSAIKQRLAKVEAKSEASN